jgi:hypothetical protein
MEDKILKNIFKAGLGKAVKSDICNNYYQDITELVLSSIYSFEPEFLHEKKEIAQHLEDCAYCTGLFYDFKLYAKKEVNSELKGMDESLYDFGEEFYELTTNISEEDFNLLNETKVVFHGPVLVPTRSFEIKELSFTVNNVKVVYEHIIENNKNYIVFKPSDPEISIECYFENRKITPYSKNTFRSELGSLELYECSMKIREMVQKKIYITFFK